MAYYILKSYKLKNDAFNIFQLLKDSKNCFFLDSSLVLNDLGRYSFLGIEPFEILKAEQDESLEKLRRAVARYNLSVPKCSIPFLGGAVGYLAYDLGFALEKKVLRLKKEDSGIPDYFFGFYNKVVIIDHVKNMLHIFCVGFPEKKHYLQKALCQNNLLEIENILSKQGPLNNENPKFKTKQVYLKQYSKREDYISAVKKAKEYIKKGDIYQVNLSQNFQATTTMPAIKVYEALRNISPASFSSYLDAGDFKILSASPERFLKVDYNNIVTTRPMKGTRRRSLNKRVDQELRNSLLKSVKDKAELMMIVDLERNDLGRVCDYGSIKVNQIRKLEEYSTVFQTTATVQAKLHHTKDRIDLLKACFPGGSITGCPKIRAMEIIEELEPAKRAIYTGSLGYMSFSGPMEFSILIRSMLSRKNKFYFGVGGGIVADSDPESEYSETLVKAKAMIRAING